MKYIKKEIFRIFICCLLMVASANAQKKVIHGKILAFNKFPIEKAKISIKKRNILVLSDSLGQFSIACELKDKVRIEAAGFKTFLIRVNDKTDSIHVNLVFGGGKKDKEIATGYGHIKESELSYGIQHFEADKNDNVNYTNIIEMIKGKVSGITMIGDQIHITVENNNGYKTEAYDYITDPNFIRSIVNDNDINFLFDISHAKITAINTDFDYDDYLSKLPLNRINQIHISKEGFNSTGEVFDAHELPSYTETKEILEFVKKYYTLKYITVEYYKDPLKLVDYLTKLKNII